MNYTNSDYYLLSGSNAEIRASLTDAIPGGIFFPPSFPLSGDAESFFTGIAAACSDIDSGLADFREA